MAEFRPVSKLEGAALREAIATLQGWTYESGRGALYQRVERPNFVEAFGLMTQIAILAEKRDHHPEWSNVYGCVDIWLTTHDAGGVSHRDIDLAGEIDRLLRST